ncbi:MAG: ABC transporter ATP-binding protein [Bdellovibrionaceae bacterium]|nr:ABC transporter ATP-binding protein [Pseudobdellovibrionaceae bacterium]
MSSVECRNIKKDFGDVSVLKDISLDVKSGEFLVLVGPSGCGKSTLLRTIAGLEQPTSGDILINGKSVLNLEPRQRDLAMVFQSYALYPHLTVHENLAFGLRLQGLAKAEIDARVREVAGTLQIEPLLDRRPRELSGGQRQRVALGRALVRKTKLILFDEPLSNLDASLRGQMRYEIKRLHALTGSTMIYVTHDQVEATTLGDRIAILNGGRIEQIATAREIYENPVSRFVASFIGTPEMNFLSGDLVGRPGTEIGVRPEDFILDQGDIEARFELQEYLGSHSLVHATIKGQPIRVMSPVSLAKKTGDTLRLALPKEKLHVFNRESGARVNA